MWKTRRNVLAGLALSAILLFVFPARADFHPGGFVVSTITVDENGHGTLDFPGDHMSITGALAADPGPGGLSQALTYNLFLELLVVPGDVVIQEVAGGPTSDIVRFNPGGAANPLSTLVFYSDNTDGADALADTGLPTARYTNLVNIIEVGPEGDNGAFYTPTANQPGFFSGYSVTYHFISDTPVPQPASLVLGFIGLIGLFLRRPPR